MTIEIRTDRGIYLAHFQITEYQWAEGVLYPVMSCSNGENESLCYISLKDGAPVERESDTEVQAWFEFSVNWRGVWDTRLYFDMPEYDGDDLYEMVKVWEKLEQILKQEVAKVNKHAVL